MSKSHKEIDGFYYDASKNRYFRVESGVNRHNPLTKKDIAQNTALEDAKKHFDTDLNVCLPKSIYYHEINLFQKYNLHDEVIRSQLKSVTLTKTSQLIPIDYRGNNLKNACCDYLIGSPSKDTLFTIISGDSGSVVMRLNVSDVFKDDYDVNCHMRLINCYPPGNRVTDIGAVEWTDVDASVPNIFGTLTNHYNDDNREHSSFTIDVIGGDYQRNPRTQSYEFSSVLNSFSAHSSGRFVIGGENKILSLKSPLLTNFNTFKTNGIVTALKFTIDANIYIAGNNKGEFSCCDLRSDHPKINFLKPSIKLSSVMYFHLLNDGNRFVMSCYDNAIVQFDIRMMNKPLLSYYGHVNNCKKIPLSIDESCDLLCSSGSDSIVRFWSLGSGKLLHIMPPPKSSLPLSNQRSCLPTNPSLNHVWYSHSWNECLNGRPKPLIFSLAWDKLNVFTKHELLY